MLHNAFGHMTKRVILFRHFSVQEVARQRYTEPMIGGPIFDFWQFRHECDNESLESSHDRQAPTCQLDSTKCQGLGWNAVMGVAVN